MTEIFWPKNRPTHPPPTPFPPPPPQEVADRKWEWLFLHSCVQASISRCHPSTTWKKLPGGCCVSLSLSLFFGGGRCCNSVYLYYCKEGSAAYRGYQPPFLSTFFSFAMTVSWPTQGGFPTLVGRDPRGLGSPGRGTECTVLVYYIFFVFLSVGFSASRKEDVWEFFCSPPQKSANNATLSFAFCVFQIKLSNLEIHSTFPTNSALVINFLLSSDAEISLISTDWACKSAPNVQKRVSNVCVFQLDSHFAYHRWWLGRFAGRLLLQKFALPAQGCVSERKKKKRWRKFIFFARVAIAAMSRTLVHCT